MKRIVLSLSAEFQLSEILRYTEEVWGTRQADAYETRLLDRLRRLAAGHMPRARPCGLLFQGEQDEAELANLTYYHEGSHYLILRETGDTLQVADLLHEKCDLERHLINLARDQHGSRE